MFRPPYLNDFNNFPNGPYILYSFVLLMLFAAFVFSEALAVFCATNFEDLFFSIALFLGHGTLVFRAVSWLYYNKEIQRVIQALEVQLKKYKQNKEVMDYCKRRFYMISLSFGVPAFFTLTFFNLTALNKEFNRMDEAERLNRSVYKERILPIPYYKIVEEEPNWFFILQWIFQDYGMYGVSIVVVTMDCFVAGLLLHIAGQFVNAQDYFVDTKKNVYEKLFMESHQYATTEANIPEDFEEIVKIKYSEERISEEMNEYLKDGIRFHQTLLKCTRDLQTAYGISFLGQLIISLFSISLTLWMGVTDFSINQSITSLGTLQSIGFFVSLSIQLFIQTSSANELTLQAENLAIRAAECRWYDADVKFRKTLMLVMLRAQVPLYMSAGGLATMSNVMFVQIMNKSYSAFAVLIRFRN